MIGTFEHRVIVLNRYLTECIMSKISIITVTVILPILSVTDWTPYSPGYNYAFKHRVMILKSLFKSMHYEYYKYHDCGYSDTE